MRAMFVYVTASSRDEAVKIGRALVGERLVACANVVDNMVSIYIWEQRLHEESEAVLILKTRSDLVEALTVRFRQLHSYTCPCVVAMPIAAGNPDYLDWIAAETAANAPS